MRPKPLMATRTGMVPLVCPCRGAVVAPGPCSILPRPRHKSARCTMRRRRWLVNNRRPPLDSQGTVSYFRGPVQRLMAEFPRRYRP